MKNTEDVADQLTFISQSEENVFLRCKGKVGTACGHVVTSLHTKTGPDGLQAYAFTAECGLQARFIDLAQQVAETPAPEAILNEHSATDLSSLSRSPSNITVIDESGERVWFKLPPMNTPFALEPDNIKSELVYFDLYAPQRAALEPVVTHLSAKHKVWLNLGDPSHHGTDLSEVLESQGVRAARWVQLSLQDPDRLKDLVEISRNHTSAFVVTQGPMGASLVSCGCVTHARAPSRVSSKSTAFAGAYFAALVLMGICKGRLDGTALVQAVDQCALVIELGAKNYCRTIEQRKI